MIIGLRASDFTSLAEGSIDSIGIETDAPNVVVSVSLTLTVTTQHLYVTYEEDYRRSQKKDKLYK